MKLQEKTTSHMEWLEIKRETLDLVLARIICQEAGLTIGNLTLTNTMREILVGFSRMEIKITEQEIIRAKITGRALCCKTSNTTTASTMVTRGTDNILTDSTDRTGRTDNRHSTVSMDTENRLGEQRT